MPEFFMEAEFWVLVAFLIAIAFLVYKAKDTVTGVEAIGPDGKRVTYTADIEWGTPPFASGYKSYIRDAKLTLRDENGTVLSSSAYSLDGVFQMGKWATSRSKLAPVVTALVTGFDH